MNRLIRYILIFTAAVLGLAMSSCSDNEPVNPGEHPAPTKRTVLIYMAANNSLSGFVSYDLEEMRQAVQRNGLNGCRVLVYLHPKGNPPVLYDLDASGELVALRHYEQGTMAVDASQMSQVIADAKELAPAADYGLVLWSHATGWVDPPVSGDTNVICRSFGDETAGGVHYGMKIPVLAQVLDGQGFSFVYFDCCNMATVEVAYELRNATSWIVGSAVELPGEGMPYDMNLPLFVADDPDLVRAAGNTFDFYGTKDLSRYWCGMAAIYTPGLGRLAASTRRLFEECHDRPVRSQVQSLMYGQSTLYDLEDYIQKFNPPQYLLNDWVTALRGAVKYAACTPVVQSSGIRIPVDTYCGLGTYVLESRADATRGYDSLQWWTDVVEPMFRVPVEDDGDDAKVE